MAGRVLVVGLSNDLLPHDHQMVVILLICVDVSQGSLLSLDPRLQKVESRLKTIFLILLSESHLSQSIF